MRTTSAVTAAVHGGIFNAIQSLLILQEHWIIGWDKAAWQMQQNVNDTE